MFRKIPILKNQLIEILDRFKKESPKLPFFIVYFFFIVLIRTFLESIYSEYPLDFETFFHFLWSFFWVATSIMVITKLFLMEESIETIAKFIFTAMSIILLPPIIDLIVSQGSGLYMSYYTDYINPNLKVSFWKEFFTFFGTYKGYGATPGIKIELLIGLTVAFTYIFFIREKKFLTSVVYVLLIYLIVVTLGFFPQLFTSLLSNFGEEFRYSQKTLGSLFFLFTAINYFLLVRLEKSDQFKISLNTFGFFLLSLLAILLMKGFPEKIVWNQELFLRIIFLFGALIMAGEFKKAILKPKEIFVIAFSLIFSAYISFLALFFMTIFFLGNFIQPRPFKRIIKSFSYINIACLGQETFYPNKFIELQIFLGLLFFIWIWALFKERKLANSIKNYFQSLSVKKKGGQYSLENSNSD